NQALKKDLLQHNEKQETILKSFLNKTVDKTVEKASKSFELQADRFRDTYQVSDLQKHVELLSDGPDCTLFLSANALAWLRKKAVRLPSAPNVMVEAGTDVVEVSHIFESIVVNAMFKGSQSALLFPDPRDTGVNPAIVVGREIAEPL